MRCHPSCLLTIGLLLIFASIMVPILMPIIFDHKLSSKLVLKPSSKMLEKFIQPPAEMFLRVWIFNITNPDDVMEGRKAILKEVGPYTYRQIRKKVDLKFKHDIGTVQFKHQKLYYFEPKLSSGYESDAITTLNPVYISLAKRSSTNLLYRFATQAWFSRFKFKPLMTHLARDLLFSGYEDPLIKQLYNLTNSSKLKNGRSGFLYPKNGTSSLQFEIYTGEKGMSNYQNIYKFNETEMLSYWKTDYCNMINGTDGSQFPRPVNHDRIYLFSEDLCRSIYADFEKEVFHGKLKLRRYVLTKELLSNSPENSCFCSTKMTCKSSMIDVSPCKDGAPIVISTPHFYHGSHYDRAHVIGLDPKKELHETFLDVEPTTGVTLRATKRIQINLIFSNYGDFPLLRKIKRTTIMPILWVSESASVNESKANKIHESLSLVEALVWYGSLLALFFGFVFAILGCIFLCKIKDPLPKLTKL